MPVLSTNPNTRYFYQEQASINQPFINRCKIDNTNYHPFTYKEISSTLNELPISVRKESKNLSPKITSYSVEASNQVLQKSIVPDKQSSIERRYNQQRNIETGYSGTSLYQPARSFSFMDWEAGGYTDIPSRRYSSPSSMEYEWTVPEVAGKTRKASQDLLSVKDKRQRRRSAPYKTRKASTYLESEDDKKIRTKYPDRNFRKASQQLSGIPKKLMIDTSAETLKKSPSPPAPSSSPNVSSSKSSSKSSPPPTPRKNRKPSPKTTPELKQLTELQNQKKPRITSGMDSSNILEGSSSGRVMRKRN